MSFTAKDIQTAVTAYPKDEWTGGPLEALAQHLEWRREPVKLGELGEIKVLDAKWGEEGGGEHIWFVFSVGDDEQTWRFHGYYDSYDGCEWLETLPEKVIGKPKTVTVWSRAD